MSVYVFQNCKQLESVTLPANLQTMGQYVFAGCSKLATVTYTSGTEEGNSLPQTLTLVGNYAFQNCTSLTNMKLPGVTTAGTYLFSGCTKLEKGCPRRLFYGIAQLCFQRLLQACGDKSGSRRNRRHLRVPKSAKALKEADFENGCFNRRNRIFRLYCASNRKYSDGDVNRFERSRAVRSSQKSL